MATKIEYGPASNGKLHIPDISDKIVLTKKWAFRLFNEYRNEKFIDAIINTPYIDKSKLEKVTQDILDHNKMTPDVPFRGGSKYTVRGYIEKTLMEPIFYNSYHGKNTITFDYGIHEFHMTQKIYDNVRPIVTLPVGTEMTVDRIYVRKGVSDYSSITFNVKNLVNKKGFRFWVKLADTRGIEGDIYPRIR